jgi:alginate O-acetyltransferase complex protein AlgI
MTLLQILVFSLVALLIGWLAPHSKRVVILLVASLLAIYWLQPSTPIRNLDFWLPTVSVVLTVFVWAATRNDPIAKQRIPWAPLIAIVGTTLAIGMTRYTGLLCCLTPSRPPDLLRILLALCLAAGITALPILFPSKNRYFLNIAIVLILGLFIVLKTPSISQSASAWLRSRTGQAVDLATAIDLPWLGFSYLAFRLLHVLRDRQMGKLPAISLDEFVSYALFFPAFTAGPIDRSQRFVADLHRIAAPQPAASSMLHPPIDDWIVGSQRVVLGIFKKFVLADSLALISLNAQNAGQVTSTGWMWVLLLAYALRIYFDFSGYTDIAIGLGRLAGIHLPENFEQPYLKPNLTAFWNSWHMTLAQWFRAYYFNPVTRALRTRFKKLPTALTILFGQVSTMALIGLWHGITWSFLAWGVWHGLGLFVHNRWADWARPRLADLKMPAGLLRVSLLAGWALTFLFVVLGWVWFALPSVGLSLQVFSTLFGF